MSDQSHFQETATTRIEGEPLHAGLYSTPTSAPISTVHPSKPEKPNHYKVICISMYNKDLERLDEMVDALKAKGLTKANRSALIRYALNEVDLERVPQGL